MTLILLLLAAFSVGSEAKAKVCKPPPGSPKCVCETSEGTIDLTPLGNADGVTAK